MTVIEAGGGRCICELKVGEEHQNRGGLLHGGMSASLVDAVSTLALMSNDNTGPGVSVNMNISLVLSPCLCILLSRIVLAAVTKNSFDDIGNTEPATRVVNFVEISRNIGYSLETTV